MNTIYLVVYEDDCCDECERPWPEVSVAFTQHDRAIEHIAKLTDTRDKLNGIIQNVNSYLESWYTTNPEPDYRTLSHQVWREAYSKWHPTCVESVRVYLETLGNVSHAHTYTILKHIGNQHVKCSMITMQYRIEPVSLI